MAWSVQAINDIVAVSMFDGQAQVSGMFLTILFSVILTIVIYSLAKDLSPKIILVPTLMVTLMTTALGWIDSTLGITIMLIIGLITASMVSRVWE